MFSKIKIGFAIIFGPFLLKLCGKVKVGPHLKLRGFPLLEIASGASVLIGRNVTLNSSNLGYHINMHSAVKLLADGDKAVIEIGDNTRIHGTCIHARERITIGKNCLIAANCQIMDSNAHELMMHDPSKRLLTTGKSRPIVIGDNVWIGANVIVLPGAAIGSGSVIGAGSVVLGTIPPNVVAAGNPAITINPPNK